MVRTRLFATLSFTEKQNVYKKKILTIGAAIKKLVSTGPMPKINYDAILETFQLPKIFVVLNIFSTRVNFGQQIMYFLRVYVCLLLIKLTHTPMNSLLLFPYFVHQFRASLSERYSSRSNIWQKNAI